MNIPKELKFTKDHEWIRVENQVGLIGITDFAQDQLGDIVFVDLPKIGKTLKKGESFGVVESVKTVSDLFSPVDGKVVAINEELVNKPDLINQDPYGKAWMIRLEMSNSSQVTELLSAESYGDLIREA